MHALAGIYATTVQHTSSVLFQSEAALGGTHRHLDGDDQTALVGAS